MAEFFVEKRVVVKADPSALADTVAQKVMERLLKRTKRGVPTHLALTGGTIGTEVLRRVGRHRQRDKVDWSLVHVWWGDERFVARDSDDRNEVGARAALLDLVDLPAENIHAMAASDDGLDLDAAADAYAAELAQFAMRGLDWPEFAICFLGVGSDGHIASLFPDRQGIQVTDRAVVAVRDSPKPPAERISLTRPVINGSKRVYLVLTGADKASALGLALAGASYDQVPAAGAKGTHRTVFYVDQAAASQVPEELIDPDY